MHPTIFYNKYYAIAFQTWNSVDSKEQNIKLFCLFFRYKAYHLIRDRLF